MENDQESLYALYKTLNERQRPEDVAQMILDWNPDSSNEVNEALQKAARKSIRATLHGWLSSMPSSFQQPHGMQKQLAKAEEIFAQHFSDNPADYFDAAKVAAYVQQLNISIGKTPQRRDFKNHRLDSKQRKEYGLELSRRRYNKLFRHLGRLEMKLDTLLLEQQKLRFTKISKASLAAEISWADFSQDPAAARFVAYFTARSYRRSVFTAYGQEKPYDEVADALYQAAIKTSSPNWWVIAHVYPKDEVLRNLSSQQKGLLLGKWTNIIHDVATLLELVWNKSDINRATMVVRRGNDSSTWNQTAGAWNKARDSWMALVYSLGMEEILHTVCFGKAMRLIAGDVAAWHSAIGNGTDPDTRVWNEVALPWQVFSREAKCTIDEIRNICAKYGVDPEKSGWIAPRPRTHIEAYRPTPELVHGIVVESPFLAKILKDAGFFSGKDTGKVIGSPDAMGGLHAETLAKHYGDLEPAGD